MAARDRLSNFTEIPFIYGKHELMPRLIFGILKIIIRYRLSEIQ